MKMVCLIAVLALAGCSQYVDTSGPGNKDLGRAMVWAASNGDAPAFECLTYLKEFAEANGGAAVGVLSKAQKTRNVQRMIVDWREMNCNTIITDSATALEQIGISVPQSVELIQ